jgi:hypothetical protein
MCPLCLIAVSTTERELLSHMLASHPAEITILTAVLSLAQLALARRPTELLAFDLLVLGAGVVLARQGRRGW